MSQQPQQPQAPQKPSMLGRLYNGVTGAVSHAFGYLPRGVMYTAGIFAGSAVLESVTGYGLGVANWSNADIINRGLIHVGLGAGISAALGGYSCACADPTAANGKSASASPSLISQSEASLGQHIVKSVADQGMSTVTQAATQTVTEQFVGNGLPMIANAAKTVSTGIK